MEWIIVAGDGKQLNTSEAAWYAHQCHQAEEVFALMCSFALLGSQPATVQCAMAYVVDLQYTAVICYVRSKSMSHLKLFTSTHAPLAVGGEEALHSVVGGSFPADHDRTE
jgi:hypothetical protein